MQVYLSRPFSIVLPSPGLVRQRQQEDPTMGLMPSPGVPVPVFMASVLSSARFVGHMGGAEDTVRAF